MRKIIEYPNKILRKKTRVIGKVTSSLKKEIDELTEVLVKSENGAGLAATQLGITKRFFGIKDSQSKTVKVFINPRIIQTYGTKGYLKLVNKEGKEEDFLEGCLSFPNLYGTVKRYFRIEVVWEETEDKKLMSRKAVLEGFWAVVFQHELDHLNGVLFIDHIKEERGKIFRQVGEKLEKEEINELKVESLKV